MQIGSCGSRHHPRRLTSRRSSGSGSSGRLGTAAKPPSPPAPPLHLSASEAAERSALADAWGAAATGLPLAGRMMRSASETAALEDDLAAGGMRGRRSASMNAVQVLRQALCSCNRCFRGCLRIQSACMSCLAGQGWLAPICNAIV